jgi:hypothetical protein
LLNNLALLQDLKGLMMLECSGSVTTPTGIPPHIHHAKLTTRCLDLCQMTLTEVKHMVIEVRQAVSDAFEDQAIQNGVVTTQTLADEMFKEHNKKMDELITTRLAALQAAGGGLIAAATVNTDKNQEPEFAKGGLDEDEPTTTTTVPTTPAMYCTYTHGGHFWHTPLGFALPPRMKLDTGWKIWSFGIPCYQIKNADDGTAQAAPIRPFRAFKSKMLPKQIERDFNLHWRPIFEMMDACPGMLPLDNSTNNLDDSFDPGLEYLKTRVAYVFQKRKANPIKWELSTWSKHVCRSSITKYGTESDKAAFVY